MSFSPRDHSKAPSCSDVEHQLEVFQNYLQTSDGLERFLSKLYDMVVILNDCRQIIFANHYFLHSIGKSSKQVLGNRFGEAVDCLNAEGEKVECGASSKCADCPALQGQMRAMNSNHLVDVQCQIETIEHKRLNWDIRFSPLPIKSHTFLICKIEIK